MSIFSSKEIQEEIVVDPNIKTHKNGPYALEKLERARVTIKKYGLPKDLNEGSTVLKRAQIARDFIKKAGLPKDRDKKNPQA